MHSSAQRGDAADTGHRRPLAKSVSGPANRSGGARTGAPSLKPVGEAVAPSKALNRATNRNAAGGLIPTANEVQESSSTSIVVRELRPKQVLAATLLVQGRQGKEVAKALNVSEETISRWRHRPEFQALMRELLQETIDATRLGIVSLCAESILHLRGLIQSFSDETSLKAITLVLGKVGPVLGVIGTEMGRQPEVQRR